MLSLNATLKYYNQTLQSSTTINYNKHSKAQAPAVLPRRSGCLRPDKIGAAQVHSVLCKWAVHSCAVMWHSSRRNGMPQHPTPQCRDLAWIRATTSLSKGYPSERCLADLEVALSHGWASATSAEGRSFGFLHIEHVRVR